MLPWESIILSNERKTICLKLTLSLLLCHLTQWQKLFTDAVEKLRFSPFVTMRMQCYKMLPIIMDSLVLLKLGKQLIFLGEQTVIGPQWPAKCTSQNSLEDMHGYGTFQIGLD